jgi:hypothetical protein
MGLAACWVLLAGLGSARAGDEPPAKVIPAAEAADHEGQRCTVEMTVKASKKSEHRALYYLDSEDDYRDPRNLAVLIAFEHAEKFRKAGIDDPAGHYRGKTIRVTGKIIDEAEQTRIRVTEPSQIRIVEPRKP